MQLVVGEMTEFHERNPEEYANIVMKSASYYSDENDCDGYRHAICHHFEVPRSVMDTYRNTII